MMAFDGKTGSSIPARSEKALAPGYRAAGVDRIVLESVLRHCDGKKITEEHVRQLANWKPNARATTKSLRAGENSPAGPDRHPVLADLAAMRSVRRPFGQEPQGGGALVPVDLVVTTPSRIDHYASRTRSIST